MTAWGKIPSEWRMVPLADLVVPVRTIQPADQPAKSFAYFDIASINSKRGVADNPKSVTGRDAPSRARQMVLQALGH